MLRPWSPSLYITGQAMQETHFPEPPSLCASEWDSVRQGSHRSLSHNYLSYSHETGTGQTDTHPLTDTRFTEARTGSWKPCVALGWRGSWDSTPSEGSTQCCRLRLATGTPTGAFSSSSRQTDSEPSGSGPQTKHSWPPRSDAAAQPPTHARLCDPKASPARSPWAPQAPLSLTSKSVL